MADEDPERSTGRRQNGAEGAGGGVDGEEPERFLSRGKNGRQMRKVREDGWTARKIRIFLDHYAEHGLSGAACAAAGMSEGAAYRLRMRDEEFAELYDAAHAVSRLRLDEMLILYTKTGGRIAPIEPGATEPGPIDLANFDPELALRILSRPKPSRGWSLWPFCAADCCAAKMQHGPGRSSIGPGCCESERGPSRHHCAVTSDGLGRF